MSRFEVKFQILSNNFRNVLIKNKETVPGAQIKLLIDEVALQYMVKTIQFIDK